MLSVAPIAPGDFEGAGVSVPNQNLGPMSAHGVEEGALNGPGHGRLLGRKISGDLAVAPDLPVALILENEVLQMGHSGKRSGVAFGSPGTSKGPERVRTGPLLMSSTGRRSGPAPLEIMSMSIRPGNCSC